MEGYRFGARKRSRSNQIEPIAAGYYPDCTMERGPDEVQNAWSAYSCPLCHAIFRLPAGSRGVMVECPSCGEIMGVDILRSPAAAAMKVPVRPRQFKADINLEEDLPKGRVKVEQSRKTDVVVNRRVEQEFRKADVMVSPATGQEFRKAGSLAGRASGQESEDSLKSQPPAEGTIRKRKKRRRKVAKGRGRSKRFDWDSETSQEPTGGTQGAPWKIVLLGGLFAAVLIAGVLVLFLVDRDEGGGGASSVEAMLGREGVVLEAENEEGVLVEELRTVDIDAEIAAMIDIVESFLGATTVDELLDFTLRDRYQQDRIREYYRTREVKPQVAKQIAAGGRIVKNGDLWATDVIFSDNSRRPITVRRSESGYRVDWESWVGYSEMTWEEIREVRTMTPVVFRVLCSKVQYYNYGFRDENKWTSFRLQSPDREHTLFGYVERRSEEEKRLIRYGNDEGNPRAFIVKIRFAEGSGPDQVIIDEVISTGWSAVGDKFGFSDSPAHPE